MNNDCIQAKRCGAIWVICQTCGPNERLTIRTVYSRLVWGICAGFSLLHDFFIMTKC